MRVNARLDASHKGPLHLFKDAGVAADSPDRHPKCNGKLPVRCQQELHIQGFFCTPTGKNSEDSNLVSMKAMLWILLYLSN
jgi:hypothetical protein